MASAGNPANNQTSERKLRVFLWERSGSSSALAGLFWINRRRHRWGRRNQLNTIEGGGRRTRGPHRWCDKPPAFGSRRCRHQSRGAHPATSRGSKGTCRCASDAAVSLRRTGTKVPVDRSLGAATFLWIFGISCTPTERNHERSTT
jgi:hypothetical protein